MRDIGHRHRGQAALFGPVGRVQRAAALKRLSMTRYSSEPAFRTKAWQSKYGCYLEPAFFNHAHFSIHAKTF